MRKFSFVYFAVVKPLFFDCVAETLVCAKNQAISHFSVSDVLKDEFFHRVHLYVSLFSPKVSEVKHEV